RRVLRPDLAQDGECDVPIGSLDLHARLACEPLLAAEGVLRGTSDQARAVIAGSGGVVTLGSGLAGCGWAAGCGIVSRVVAGDRRLVGSGGSVGGAGLTGAR